MPRHVFIGTVGLITWLSAIASPAFGQRTSSEEVAPKMETRGRARSSVRVAQIEEVPADAPIVHVLNEEAKLRGGIASAAGTPVVESFVYKNFSEGRDNLTALFFNWGPNTTSATTNALGFPIPNPIQGVFEADNMTFGNGFRAGIDAISSYEVFVFRSTADPLGAASPPAFITLELWDGDPLNEVDLVGGGYASAPIPGTQCTIQVPFGVRVVARCELVTPVVPPHDRVWMVMTADATCRLGWILASTKPQIGFDAPSDVLQIQTDDDAGLLSISGTCCDSGLPCGPGVPCAGDPTGSLGRCSDGDAEAPSTTSLGGPCTGNDPAIDSCANFYANIFATARTTISLVPVSNHPDGSLDSGVQIVGNEMTLVRGGSRVFLEGRIGDWDPDDVGVTIDAYAVETIDTLSPGSVSGNLVQPLVSCTDDAPCASAFGGACSSSATSCATNADCPTGETCISPQCSFGSCCPEYINTARSDFVFKGLPNQSVVRCSFGFSDALSSLASGAVKNDPVPFPSAGLYAATVIVEVPPDGRGTFDLDLQFLETNLISGGGGGLPDQTYIPLLGHVGAKITVTVGVCCYDLNGSATCVDNVTVDDCDALPGPRSYLPNVSCPPTGCGGDCNANGSPDFMDLSAGGPDCNGNSVLDECEVPPIGSASPDCNANGRPDACDIADGTAGDCDRNGVPDACDNVCVSVGAPQPETFVPANKSRYVSFQSVNAGCRTAIRLTPISLPNGLEQFVGRAMWISGARDFCESAGQDFERPCPLFPGTPSPLMWTASLSCTPSYRDWGALGTVHVHHDIIVPGGIYELQETNEGCDTAAESSFSAALARSTSVWGDVAAGFDPGAGSWTPPDGRVDVAVDVVAMLNKFGNRPGAPAKARVDLAPAIPDKIINVLDLVRGVDAFRGLPFPFPANVSPCGP